MRNKIADKIKCTRNLEFFVLDETKWSERSGLLALTGLRLGRAGCDPLGKRATIIVLSRAYRNACVSLNCGSDKRVSGSRNPGAQECPLRCATDS